MCDNDAIGVSLYVFPSEAVTSVLGERGPHAVDLLERPKGTALSSEDYENLMTTIGDCGTFNRDRESGGSCRRAVRRTSVA